MLKRVLAISAALLIGAFAFAQTSADGGASPAAAGSVNATWEWNKIPKSKIGTDYMKFKKPVVLQPVAGSKGAEFALATGEAKFKNEGYVALYHNGSDSARLENLIKKAKAQYTVKIDDAANITLTIAGNGTKSPARIVCLVKDDVAEDATTLTPILFADNLSQDEAPFPITFSNAPKGSYRIYIIGARIVKVEAKN